jgi:hypothetical protein
LRSRKYYIEGMLLATLILSVSFQAFQNFLNVKGLPANSMWIEPTTLSFNSTTAPVGYRFNVTIYANLSVASYAWQFFLTYNKEHLNATGCWYSAGAKSQWAGTRPTSPQTPSYGTHNATHNYVLFAETLQGDVQTPPGSYSLAIIEFQIIAQPGQGQTYQSQLRLDITGAFNSYVLDVDLNEIPLNFGGASYSYESVPTPLPKPWLEAVPNEYKAIRPEEFSIDIYIRDVDAGHKLIGLQFNLTYNPSVITPINVKNGTFMSNSSWAIYGTYPMWRVEEDRVIYGELILPNPNTGEWDQLVFPHGEGLVATITFKTLVHEAANFNITINPLFGEFFLDADLEYIPYNPPKSCTFTYEPLPVPTIKVSPEHYISSSLGETFQINIDIQDLNVLWNLTYVEFKLQFDGSLIEAIDVTEGSFLSQFGTTSFAFDISDNCVSVNITLTEPATYPSGSGTLATITFNVTSRPPATSPLTLSDVLLLDVEGREILYELSHGYYEMYEFLVHEIVAFDVIYYVTTLSNGSISPVPMQFDIYHRLLKFSVAGTDGTVGFVNVTIPKDLLWVEDGWLVIVGGEEVEPIVTSNATHTTLSFTVSFSNKTVYIIGTGVIPEFSSFMLLAFLFITLIPTVATKMYLKRKKP